MLFYPLTFFCSFLLGALLVLTDFFPARSLVLQNILGYLSFQSAQFMRFGIERELFRHTCECAAVLFSVTVLLPLAFPERDRKIAKTACATALCMISAAQADKTFNLREYFLARFQNTVLYDTEYKNAHIIPPPPPPSHITIKRI